MPHYFNDKRVLVTGGSAGLGLVLARAFHDAGAKVAIVGRDASRLASATEALGGSSAGDVLAVPADVTQDDDVRRAVAATAEAFGGLDVLVNCAGKSSRGAIAETSADQFRELLEINFLSAVRCTQAVLPHLLASRGHVVLIGSLASKSAARFLGAYPASKFPLAAYAQQLRLELGPEGLHSLLVCPGPIRRDDAGQRYDEQAANLPEAARKPGGGVKLSGIDPADLARRILAACERREPELVVPGKSRLLFAIAQLWPSWGDRLLLKFTRG